MDLNLDWEYTMDPEEYAWCVEQILNDVRLTEAEYADSFRAARVWEKDQIERFEKLRSCCGRREWFAYRHNPKTGQQDKYLLGYNYGH